MKFLVVFLLFFVGANFVQASAVPKPQTKIVEKQGLTIIKVDSSKIELRRFDEQVVQKYSKQKEFSYDDVAPKGLSWWDRLWRWIWNILDRIFSGKGSPDVGFSKILFVILKWLLVASLIAAIAFLIVKIFGLDLRLLIGKSKAIDVPYEESLENIHEINFDDQIENALQNSNYRLAVRLLYLKTLKQLSDQSLINWQLEKTNQAYVLEIENPNQQQAFIKLTKQFEYIWYGEFFIDKNSFEPINQSFLQFNEQAK